MTAIGQGSTQYEGKIRLSFTTDAGEQLTYDVPGAVYDPDCPFNILGVPCLSEYFARRADDAEKTDDGTWILSRATRQLSLGITASIHEVLLMEIQPYPNWRSTVVRVTFTHSAIA